MENLFDLLLPIIFIVGSILLNIKRKDKDEDEPEVPEENSSEVRDIREEIRRKIQEAQKQVMGSETEEPSLVESPPVKEEKPPVVAQVQEVKTYQKLDRMREEVAEMRKRAEAERKKASVIRKREAPVHSIYDQVKVERKGIVREVISELRHPVSARKAVLNAEILGTPIGLRKPEQTKASWDL